MAWLARAAFSFTLASARAESRVGRGETPERESERQREPERTVRRERGKHGRDEPRAITNPSRRGVCAQLTAHSDYLLASVSFGSMCSSGLSEWPTTLTDRERDVADGASNHSDVVGSDPATVFLVWCWAGMGKAASGVPFGSGYPSTASAKRTTRFSGAFATADGSGRCATRRFELIGIYTQFRRPSPTPSPLGSHLPPACALLGFCGTP